MPSAQVHYIDSVGCQVFHMMMNGLNETQIKLNESQSLKHDDDPGFNTVELEHPSHALYIILTG